MSQCAKKLRLCPICGAKSSADSVYCHNCGHSFVEGVQSVPRKRTREYESHWRKRFPGIYDEVRNPSRIDLESLFRLFYSPSRALASLYQSASLKGALLLVTIIGICALVVSRLLSQYHEREFAENLVSGLAFFFSDWVLIAMLAFFFTKIAVGGKVDAVATLTLGGYVQAFIGTVAILGSSVYAVANHLSESEALPAIVCLALVLPLGFYGLGLWGMAIGLANDVSDNTAGFASAFAIIGALCVHEALGWLVVSLGITSISFLIPLPF